ncbi:CinA family protein [Paracerasibacillus soli]|uniref:CinA family protein n=1 Tax=Paracerasibacillus soli TaxID=480284 RepID=A0ABU5CPD7_9BACI|nr:CinA family protein [Virgibacillus soli]MDY0408216.1 CinA family protein [Virgibacillus soli]
MKNKPVGTVFIGLHDDKGNHIIQEHLFTGDRESIRRKSVLKGLEILIQFLKDENR